MKHSRMSQTARCWDEHEETEILQMFWDVLETPSWILFSLSTVAAAEASHLEQMEKRHSTSIKTLPQSHFSDHLNTHLQIKAGKPPEL